MKAYEVSALDLIVGGALCQPVDSPELPVRLRGQVLNVGYRKQRRPRHVEGILRFGQLGCQHLHEENGDAPHLLESR